jgi:NAD(P)H dehydrogenase (quinone)
MPDGQGLRSPGGKREMIVITNGTSPFSRLVVQHLLTRLPAGEIAVTTAEPDAAADLGAMGIDVRQERFDPTLDAMAFGAGDRVLVVSRPGDTGSGAPAGNAAAAVDAAVAAFAGHIAYTSIINADMTNHLGHLAIEEAIKQSGVSFTLLRDNLYSEALLPALRLASGTSELIWSAGDRLLAPAALTDYAEAAVIVLTDHQPESRTLQLSGPLGLTALGVASAFSQVLGKEIGVREVAATDLDAALTGAGASPEVAAELATIFNDTSLGEWSVATQTLEELLGHDRISLVAALQAAYREGVGQSAGS